MPEGDIFTLNTGSYNLEALSRLWRDSMTVPATYMTSTPELQYIKPYNYVPNFNYHKVSDEEELYLGIELEIDNGGEKDDNAKMVIDFLGNQNVYCKHDGSLAQGFEIVTHPCTYDYHLGLAYEDLFKKLSNLGYRSHDVSTCGMHIHFNRNYFGKDKLTQDLNISKLLYVFEKFWSKVVIIARRDSNHYARRYYLNKDETPLDIYAKSKNSDKYGAINLQHKDTVEIRIFKGTLNYNTYISTIEFVDTIVKIIKNIDIYNIQYLTWENISAQFSDGLNAYIKEREEAKKKEKQDEVHSMVRNYYSDFRYYGGVDFSREYMSCFTSSPSIQLAETRIPHINRNDLNLIDVNDMTVEQLKSKIKFIKEDMRRANGMEKLMLQRELNKYTNRLGELRRRH